MYPDCGWSEWRTAPEFNAKMNYVHTGRNRAIRVYKAIDQKVHPRGFLRQTGEVVPQGGVNICISGGRGKFVEIVWGNAALREVMRLPEGCNFSPEVVPDNRTPPIVLAFIADHGQRPPLKLAILCSIREER
jgi:hypothetical protein